MIDMAKAAARMAAVAGILLLASSTAAAQQRKLEPEAARLIELLGLSPAASVADLGAGSGELTVEIARQLGKGSRVFSTDINQDRLREIAAAAIAAGLTNITVLEGTRIARTSPTAVATRSSCACEVSRIRSERPGVGAAA